MSKPFANHASSADARARRSRRHVRAATRRVRRVDAETGRRREACSGDRRASPARSRPRSSRSWKRRPRNRRRRPTPRANATGAATAAAATVPDAVVEAIPEAAAAANGRAMAAMRAENWLQAELELEQLTKEYSGLPRPVRESRDRVSEGRSARRRPRRARSRARDRSGSRGGEHAARRAVARGGQVSGCGAGLSQSARDGSESRARALQPGRAARRVPAQACGGSRAIRAVSELARGPRRNRRPLDRGPAPAQR